MKILISTDIEGISCMNGRSFPSPSSKDYISACKQLTKEINLVIRECFRNGAKEVLVADGHGSGTNIIKKEMDHKAKLFQRKTKDLTMMEGAEIADFCIFLGYHGKANVPNSFYAHTNSSRSISSVFLNGQEVGESEINAAIGKFFDCKLIFAIGTDKAIEEIKESIKIESVITKYSISQYRAKLRDWEDVKKEIIEKLENTFKNLDKINPIKLDVNSVEWTIKVPYVVLLEDLSIKGLKRIGKNEVRIEKCDIFEGFKIYKMLQEHLSLKYIEYFD